jgi:hypothetical protein
MHFQRVRNSADLTFTSIFGQAHGFFAVAAAFFVIVVAGTSE